MRQYSDYELECLYDMVLKTEEVFKECGLRHRLVRPLNTFKNSVVGEMALRGMWDFAALSPRDVRSKNSGGEETKKP